MADEDGKVNSSQTVYGVVKILDFILKVREVSEEFSVRKSSLPVGNRDCSTPVDN